MYGTTIRSYNENKNTINTRRERADTSVNEHKKETKGNKKNQDTKYVSLNNNVRNYEETNTFNEAFSIKDLPIASVVITLILAFVFLHEEFTVKSLIGCILLAAGTLVMVL